MPAGETRTAPQSKSCRDCGAVLPITDFRLLRSKGREWRLSYCGACERVRSRAAVAKYKRTEHGRAANRRAQSSAYARDPEKFKTKADRWAAENLDRLRPARRAKRAV